MRVPKLVLMILTLTALLWPSRAESPVHALVSRAPADVRIEYQLIHVTDPVQPRRRTVPAHIGRMAAVNRLAAVSKPVQRSRQGALAVRAGRLLMGDGRYRPEPFPRPGR